MADKLNRRVLLEKAAVGAGALVVPVGWLSHRKGKTHDKSGSLLAGAVSGWHGRGGLVAPVVYLPTVLPGVGVGGFNTYSAQTQKGKAMSWIVNRGDAAALNTQQGTSPNQFAAVYESVAQATSTNSVGILYTEANALGNTTDGLGVLHKPCLRNLADTADLIYLGAGDTPRILDPMNTNVQNQLKTNILAYMQTIPKCKAIFFDNVEMDYRNFTNTSGDATFSALHYPDLATWQNNYREMLRAVVGYLRGQGYYCIGNDRGRSHAAIGTQDVDGTEATAWLNYLVNGDGSQIFDAHMYEYWVYRNDLSPTRIRRIGTANSYDHWTEMQGMMRAVQAKGADFYGQAWGKTTDADSAQAALYTRASFLIDWNGGYGCSMLFYPDAFGNNYGNYNGGDIGFPSGDKYEIDLAGAQTATHTNIFKRDFSNGFVIINPTYGDVSLTGGSFIGTVANGSAVVHIGP